MRPLLLPSLLLLSSLLPSSLPAADPPAWRVVVDGEGRWVAPATFRDDDHGQPDLRAGSSEQSLEARAFWRPHAAVRLGLGVGAERIAYGGDLDTTVSAGWLRAPLAVMVHPHWGLTTLTSYGTATAHGVDQAEDRRWQVQAGPLWRRDDDLLVALLVNVASRPGRRPSVFPFPSLEWRIAPDWRLTVVDEIDGVSRLAWQAREDLTLALRVDVRLRDWLVGTEPDRDLADDQYAAGIETTWLPDPRLTLSAFAGAVVVRHLTVHQGEEEVAAYRAGPAAQGGLRLRADF